MIGNTNTFKIVFWKRKKITLWCFGKNYTYTVYPIVIVNLYLYENYWSDDLNRTKLNVHINMFAVATTWVMRWYLAKINRRNDKLKTYYDGQKRKIWKCGENHTKHKTHSNGNVGLQLFYCLVTMVTIGYWATKPNDTLLLVDNAITSTQINLHCSPLKAKPLTMLRVQNYPRGVYSILTGYDFIFNLFAWK